MRPLNVLCLGALCLLAACGAPLEEDSPPPEALAVTQEQELSTACNESALAWPTGSGDSQKTCEVPWNYGLTCYKQQVSANCDRTGYVQKQCPVYQACRHPDFGKSHYASPSPQYTKTVTCAPIEEEDCQYSPDIGKVECETVTVGYACQAACQARANAEKNTVDSRFRTAVVAHVLSYTPNVPTSTCKFELQNFPIYNQQAAPPCPQIGTVQCDDLTQPIYASCRHSAHGVDSTNSCGTGTLFTTSPATLAQAKTQATARWNEPALKNEGNITYSTALSCRTCDSLPLDAVDPAVQVTQVSAKFECLKSSLQAYPTLPPAAGGATLESELVSRLKLLFELRGHQLTETQQAYVRNLYVTRPALHGTCGTAFTPPTGVDPSCPSQASLNGSLQMCQQLSSAHVPSQSAAAALNSCMDLGIQVSAISEACKAQEYRDAYHQIWLKLFEHSLADLKRSGQDQLPDQADVTVRLVQLNRWFEVQRNNVHAADPDSAELWQDVSDTLGVFWKAAYAHTLVNANGTGMVADPLNVGLKTDQVVLRAALSQAQPPLKGGALLLLLSDGFRGLFERMEDFSQLHDLGCRFKGCESGQVKTEMSELWALFASVPDAAALQNAVNASTVLAASAYPGHAEWKNIFNQLALRHGTFAAAVTASSGAPSYTPELLREPQGAPSVPLVAWAKMVQQAHAFTQSYAKAGVFQSTARNTLRIGIQESKQVLLNSHIQSRKQDLTSARDQYVANQANYVSNLLAEMGNASNQASLANQLDKKVEEFYALNEDLIGLQDNLALDEAQFGDFAGAFNTVLEQEEAQLALMQIQRTPTQTLNVDAADAHFGDPWEQIQTVAFENGGQVWKVQAQAGHLLNFRTTGLYAPSCALLNTTLANPEDPNVQLPVVAPQGGALTGPGGYIVTFQDGQFATGSTSLNAYARSSLDTKLCMGVKVEAGFKFLGNGGTAYASAEACMAASLGMETSVNLNEGVDSRTSASFATGLRVSNTPFPGAPAGSLLLVAMEKDGSAPGQIRDVRILQEPNTSVVVEADQDYYLVVNDKGGCVADTQHALTVEFTQLVPAGQAAKALGKAMAQSMTDLRAATSAAVSQGRVTSSELSALRDAASARLLTAFSQECPGCQVSDMPPVFTALFNAHVSKELARLERLLQIHAVERALRTMMLDFQFLRDDLAAGEEKARLLRLLPLWNLRNLDGLMMREGLRSLTTLVTDYLYPVMDLRYPTAIASLKTAPALDTLVRANWSADFPTLTTLAINAVSTIETKLADARLNDPTESHTLVALSFPRPNINNSNVSPWRKADSERSEALWAALASQGKFTLKLTPEDLYTAVGGASGLMQCNEGTPLLKTMAFFLVRPNQPSNDSLNSQMKRASVAWSDSFAFTGETVTKTYTMIDPLWLTGSPRILFGNGAQALERFELHETSKPEANQNITGDGLSPFGAMQVDMSDFFQQAPNPLDAATELVVMLKVDKRAVLDVSQPQVCQ
ncbi:hypothetical protein [Hyalangium gracile]|uniref:hypothetical protein n=1 Tax=Hyalangium gracile TaxID=394092 RepID=UPI001CCDE1D5|nr:hypothetical protein [Hyalangium gracile]